MRDSSAFTHQGTKNTKKKKGMVKKTLSLLTLLSRLKRECETIKKGAFEGEGIVRKIAFFVVVYF